jgi:dihydrofolate reductase
MAKLVVINHVSLDGVMQSPGGPDEDPRDGFPYGGWAHANSDEVMGRAMGTRMQGGPLLFGRRTYEQFFGFWPHQTDNPYTDALNKAQKYVVSTTLSEPLPWQNSTLISTDVPKQIARIKQSNDKNIVVLGSGELVQTLLDRHLVDEFIIMIHPIVFGTGRRLFREGSAHTSLKLVDTITTTKGVVIATYEAAAEPR